MCMHWLILIHFCVSYTKFQIAFFTESDENFKSCHAHIKSYKASNFEIMVTIQQAKRAIFVRPVLIFYVIK